MASAILALFEGALTMLAFIVVLTVCWAKEYTLWHFDSECSGPKLDPVVNQGQYVLA